MNIFLNHALCCPHQFNHISSIVHLISWSIYSCVHKSPSVWIVLSQDTHMTHPLKPWFNTFLPTFFLENANNLFFFFFFTNQQWSTGSWKTPIHVHVDSLIAIWTLCTVYHSYLLVRKKLKIATSSDLGLVPKLVSFEGELNMYLMQA